MGEVLPIPRLGDVFEDVRGQGRTMRVSLHSDAAVISLWAGGICRGTFRVADADLNRLIGVLGEARMAGAPQVIAGPTARPSDGPPVPPDSAPPARDRASTAEQTPERTSEQSPEQTGDITGAGGLGRMFIVPQQRIA